MHKKFRISFVLLLAVFCWGCSGGSRQTDAGAVTDTDIPDEGIVVGFAQLGAESDWRNANTESIRNTFDEDEEFYLLFQDAQQKQEKQIKAVRDFILQEVDYIILNPIVETGWDMVLQEAKEAGIPVIIADRMVDVEDESLYTCCVGADFVKEAVGAGNWLADYLESQGRGQEEINIVTLQGTPDSTAQLGRTEGFSQVLKEHENWHMLDMQDGDFTQAKGREAMEYLLENYPDIDVVISENDNMTFGAVDAIKQAGRTCGPDGDIIIISFDAVSAALDEMIAGNINADFECNPLYGPKLREIILALEAGETVDKVQFMDETYFDTSMDLEAIKATRAY